MAQDLSAYDTSPHLYLFTSLTAGSSHIFTATSRMETILKANRVPFVAIDTATDEKARRLWQRRAGGRKLPGLVKEGFVIADINEVEDWNEFGELRENVMGPDAPPVKSGIMGMPGSQGPQTGVSALGSGGVSAGSSAGVSAGASTGASAEASAGASAEQKGQAQQQDPMRDLAAQAASIGLSRQKGPPALVDESKIKPLPNAAAPTAASAPAAAEEGAGTEASPAAPAAATKDTADSTADEPGQDSRKPTSDTTTQDEKDAAAVAGAESGAAAGVTTGTVTAGTSKDEEAEAEADRSTDPIASAAAPAAEGALASSDSLAPSPALGSAARASSETPSERSAESRSRQHRGSEVLEASQEEIKRVESERMIVEDGEEDEEAEGIAGKAAGTKIDKEESVGKEGRDAAEMVQARESDKVVGDESKRSADAGAATVSVED